MKHLSILLAACALAVFCGCHPVENVDRVSYTDLDRESSVVFTRPARYTMFFGSRSIRDFVEIVYEQASRNAAGQLVVEVGIRNRGPVSWTNWPQHAPDRLGLKVVTNFYSGQRGASPIVYSTNRPTILIGRGQTYAYKAVCPVPNATSYQVVLGD